MSCEAAVVVNYKDFYDSSGLNFQFISSSFCGYVEVLEGSWEHLEALGGLWDWWFERNVSCEAAVVVNYKDFYVSLGLNFQINSGSF